jgi:O-acetyl-ADP-ribose deacetylase (regulator of RNase III)
MNKETARAVLPNGRVLVSVWGDICEEKVDAIVNAANSRLLHGGGVAGRIVQRGGDVIQQESRALAPVPTGSAAVTSAGRLGCSWVIHAVGPVWGGGSNNEEQLLASAVRTSLQKAVEKGCRLVSFPSISAGVFGMPGDIVARVLVDTAAAFLASADPCPIQQVRFCNIATGMAERIDRALEALKP